MQVKILHRVLPINLATMLLGSMFTVGALALLLLAGCTINRAPPPQRVGLPAPPANPQPLRGQTMQAILAAHNAPAQPVRPLPQRPQLSAMPRQGITNYTAYTRTEQRELNGLFPRLPNPDLCMYVYPHLSGERSTIPGYTSCFTMYPNNEFALPGETQ